MAVVSTDQFVVALDPTIASAANQVVWFRDPSDENRQLDAYDWSGHLAGIRRLSATQHVRVRPSPDGATLVLAGGQPLSGGKVIGRTRGDGIWARDGVHLCTVLTESGVEYGSTATTPGTRRTTTNAALFLDAPVTGTRRMVARYGLFADSNRPGGGPAVLDCSVPKDRAIMGVSDLGGYDDVRALRLSDGQQSGSPEFASRLPGNNSARVVMASPDGEYIALGSSARSWTPRHETVVIRDIDSGATVATLTGGIAAFSGDDTRVLTITYLGHSNARAVFGLVDWRSGREVWHQELPGATFYTSRPASGDMLIGGEIGQHDVVVHADGSTTTFPVAGGLLD